MCWDEFRNAENPTRQCEAEPQELSTRPRRGKLPTPVISTADSISYATPNCTQVL